ncbi:uncharacterized protein LOC100186093 [Ciona intestinalis]
MAAWKLLGPGMVLGVVSVVLLVVAISTDRWYVLDASLYAQLCTETVVFEPWYSWSEPVYAGHGGYGGYNPRFKEYEAVARPMLIRDSTEHILPAPLKAIQGSHGSNSLFNVHKPQLKNEGKRKDWKRVSRNVAFLRNIFGNSTKVRNEVAEIRKERAAAWLQLMNDLNRNLYSFGGRDITLRKRKTKQNFPNKSMIHDGTISTCKKRQFSTATGLWRTCFLPEEDSMLGKLVACGNISRCISIPYGAFDSGAIPSHLYNNETVLVLGDEITSLNLRRAVVSFLFLALTVQLFGLAIIIMGWYKEEGFEQYSGGLVLLMSGIFQLCGMCTHAILCRLEMTRRPEDVYQLPTLVLESYGLSAYFAWVSFGTTLLSSFLCVMAPLHRPARPTIPCVTGRRAMVLCADKDDADASPVEGSIHPGRGNVTLQQTVTNSHVPCSKRNIKVSISHVDQITNQQTTTELVSGSSMRQVATSPVASVRTPRAAIKALEVERRNMLSAVKENEAMAAKYDCVAGPSSQRRCVHTYDLHHTCARRTSDSSSSNLNKYQYMRKTRSLPRDPTVPASSLMSTKEMATMSKFPDVTIRSPRRGISAYDSATGRIDTAMYSLTEGANERNVAEIFQSSSATRISNSDSDSEDVFSPLSSPSRAPRHKRSESNYEVWDAKSSVYLPCEMKKQRRHIPKYS